ncbi:polymer-forming cytoskeletal protein [Alkalicaulis satelles]|uniref:Polymer-forming cytoskeletal protein n=1 Tax=Alkalicaulis satelles TaxID=2609175 RepID=A0A5M6ZNP8_9PROT|nr:polymer-forming cytoskeletal protein [Alkalicaulis satelles]KAA5804858.1 polymer-forming cytoskeletal protein [Alkalicaulis satelles]
MKTVLRAILSGLAGAMTAGALLAGGASAQYVGGNLQLDLDERGDVNIAGANVRLSGRVGGSVSAASADFFSSADIGGDLDLAAANVTIAGPVHGDISGFAANITIDAPVGGDVSAAGANITVLNTVAGEMNVRGALITLGRDGEVSGPADWAGREIIIEGALVRGGKLSARDVRISGVVNGPLEIAGRHVRFTSSASITGPVTVRSPNPPELSEGADVADLNYIEAPFEDSRRARRGTGPEISMRFLPSPWAVGGVLGASAFLLGLLASIVAPRGVGAVAASFRRRPFVSGFLGLVVLALLPVLTLTLFVLLAVTIIGIPLAMLLFLAFPIVLFLAFAFGGLVVGDAVMNRTGTVAGLGLRTVSFFLAIIAIIALSAVPVLGFIVLPLVLCIGLGAWTLAIFGRESLKGLETSSASEA